MLYFLTIGHPKQTITKSEEEHSKAEKHLEQIKKTSQKYHDELQGISDDIHPFIIKNNKINNAQMIEASLESRAHPQLRGEMVAYPRCTITVEDLQSKN